MTVFLGHLASQPFTEAVIWRPLGTYGVIAVTIFFVLSGYVIAHVTSTRETTASTYAAARISRLYSVVLVALALTFLFDTLGTSLNPEFYAFKKVLWKPINWEGYVSALFFVNEFQVFRFNGISPGTNAPYWSLSFEAAYYLISGIVLFSRRRVWVPLCVIILFCAGRTIVALFPIWAMGYFLYHQRLKIDLPRSLLTVLAFGTIAAILVVPRVIYRLPTDNFGFVFPWGRMPFNRNLVEDYAVGSVFVVHLASVRSLLCDKKDIGDKTKKIATWLGSLTFPMYCFHFPAICFFAALSPWDKTSLANCIAIAVPVVLLVIGLTPLCDALKRSMRLGLSKVSFRPRLSARP